MRRLVFCFVLSGVIFGGDLQASEVPARSGAAGDVIAGTSWIGAVITEITGGKIRPMSLIPPAMCPGHYDIRPSDIERAARCSVLILHDWQRAMPNVRRVMEAAALGESRVKTVRVEGNWLTPETQAQAVEAVAHVLAETFPSDAEMYRQRTAAQVKTIRQVGGKAKKRVSSAPVEQARVMCHVMWMPFLEWIGCTVVGSFDRMEDRSVADVNRLVQQARQGGVTLVVDNLQSGDAHIGKVLAEETNAAYAVLSNFPGGFRNTDTWEQLLTRNLDLLIAALGAPPDVR